ncbi:hypothetical protein HYT32_00520 [Candidatus Roizmanbacteria bacterium]|nr:hypothetical protein [Candidatus Roizmanbacteria bacterium]
MVERRSNMEHTYDLPPIQQEKLEDYNYISHGEVLKALEQFGYGHPSKRLVDAMYVRKDGSSAVGVLQVTDERCEGHFTGNHIFRGVDQVEAMGQAFLLFLHFSNKVPVGMVPRFIEINNFSFKNAAVPEMVLNIQLKGIGEIEPTRRPFSIYGKIYNGTKITSEGSIRGDLRQKRLSDELLTRARRQIQNPVFPLNG